MLFFSIYYLYYRCGSFNAFATGQRLMTFAASCQLQRAENATGRICNGPKARYNCNEAATGRRPVAASLQLIKLAKAATGCCCNEVCKQSCNGTALLQLQQNCNGPKARCNFIVTDGTDRSC